MATELNLEGMLTVKNVNEMLIVTASDGKHYHCTKIADKKSKVVDITRSYSDEKLRASVRGSEQGLTKEHILEILGKEIVQNFRDQFYDSLSEHDPSSLIVTEGPFVKGPFAPMEEFFAVYIAQAYQIISEVEFKQ